MWSAFGAGRVYSARGQNVGDEGNEVFACLTHLSLAMLALAGTLALSAAAVSPNALAAEPSAITLFAEFGFDADERREVDAGEIVAIDGATVLNNELTGAAAMRLPIPPAEVASRLRQGLVILADRQRRAYARIDAAQADPWSAVRFDERGDAEVERLFGAGPGDAFNFSDAEIAAIRRTLAGRNPQATDGPALAALAWRDVLIGRYSAYRAQGLRGLADYDRGDSVSSPAEELLRVGAAAVPRPVRGLVKALDLYPAAQSAALESRFYWKKTIVDARTVFVLSHVAVEEAPDAVLFALREYYVGHSYNVLQQLGVIVAYGNGALMLAVNSTLTDRIVGAFGVIARPVGRHQAREALRNYFAGIREWCSRPMP
jgi:hypothetical protein